MVLLISTHPYDIIFYEAKELSIITVSLNEKAEDCVHQLDGQVVFVPDNPRLCVV